MGLVPHLAIDPTDRVRRATDSEKQAAVGAEFVMICRETRVNLRN